MSADDERRALEALAARLGIDAAWDDVWGGRHTVPTPTLRAFVEAVGAPGDADDAGRALARLDAADWAATVPPTVVARVDGGRATIPVTLPAPSLGRPIAWRLALEGGGTRAGELVPQPDAVVGRRAADGVERVRVAVALEDVPLGYHELSLRTDDGTAADALLIACPARCFGCDDLAPGLRVWGPTLQLYALRSRRDWGIGDFTALAMAVEVAAAAGAGFVGLNPLHALHPASPEQASPYSPSSRSRLNALYLDVEACPELQECEDARETIASPGFQARLESLRAAALVDYAGVSAAKHSILERLWACFRERHLGRDTDAGRAFARFLAEEGEPLRLHALHEAIQTHLVAQDPSVWGWPAWPEALRDPRGEAALAFEREHADRVGYFAWLQWRAETQLAAAAERARALGMPIGLYRDLAVGVAPGGADTWREPGVHAPGARVGAPPDEFNPAGQDWGLPPMIPSRLRERRYAPFVEAVRANMRSAGALRIDHVMGLMRLFWVPPGGTPADGAYVACALEDLAGIVALESVRRRCVVVGEDLGTVAPAVREAMSARAMLSYKPLWFERLADGGFAAPRDWAPEALAAVSTHDLPTLAGFWRGVDLEARQALALFPNDEIRARTLLGRSVDRAQLLLALERERLLPEGTGLDPLALPGLDAAFVAAVHAYVARTPCRLVAFQMEDAFGQLDQVNLPATTEAQFPNWRRRLEVPLERWDAHDGLRALVAAMVRERGTAPRPAAAGPGGASRGALVPRATYRVQFHAGFTFADATRIVPYLAALGVSHLYASPYLKARPGSTHGYDIVDHGALNPEIGDEADHARLCEALEAHGIAQILDIVPNHMGVLGSDNVWWLDVLENGRASPYAGHFDIEWEQVTPLNRGRVLVPVLGEQYGRILERGEIRVVFDADAGTIEARYWDHRFPVDPREYREPLEDASRRLAAGGRADPDAVDELASLADAFGHLPPRDRDDEAHVAQRRRDRPILKRRLAELCARVPAVGAAIEESLAELNGRAGDGASFERLHALLERQAFRLAHWRVASDDINYRRFFDINDLAALRMESRTVFDDAHRLVFRLLDEGRLHGLRIDHPDGLYDPGEYFERLQRHAAGPGGGLAEGGPGRPLYLLVEKILAEHERLPAEWPVHGETGYRFVNLVNGLFVDPSAAARMERIWTGFTGEAAGYDALLERCKKLILSTSLSSELTVLTYTLHRIARADRATRDFTLNSLRAALAELVAAFPVYRSYIVPGRVRDGDRRHVERAIGIARRRARQLDASLFDFLRDLLLERAARAGDPDAPLLRAFVGRFQQLTAPVTAKAMEDTSFYLYNRLVSLNEVGGDPRVFGVPPADFHRAMLEQARTTPHTMLAGSTHDTKRGEDLRARIDVLSEMPARWRLALRRWSRANAGRKTEVDGAPAPSANDEMLLYQTLLGAWPFGEPDAAERAALRDRIDAYMLKAVREAKANTSWINPNEAYERALSDFVHAILADDGPGGFLEAFRAEQRIVARFGTCNSLAAVLLRTTAPGVPDVYQGSELWNLSLVDPDNRRPVDYALRARLLSELDERFPDDGARRGDAVRALLESPADGRIKLLLLRRALALRARRPRLFERGEYLPLQDEGERAGHVCAYARAADEGCAVVVAPRLLLRLAGDPEGPVTGAAWGDTRLALPARLADRPLRDLLTGAVHRPRPSGDADDRTRDAGGAWLALAEVLSELPFALLADEAPARA